MSPIAGMSEVSFIGFVTISTGIVIASAVVAKREFPAWLERRKQWWAHQNIRQEFAEASWHYWAFNASMVLFTVMILIASNLFDGWVDRTIIRDIPRDNVKAERYLFGCDGHLLGVLYHWTHYGSDRVGAACLDARTMKWID